MVKNYALSFIAFLCFIFSSYGQTTIDFETAGDGYTSSTTLGEGFTDVKENKLWYKENFTFNESGIYKIKLQHAMRENGNVEGVDALEGVTDIGFRIEKQD